MLQEKTDAIKSEKFLIENGHISDVIVIMLNEMYLQKCEQYCGGEIFGADENGELYKGVQCFVNVGSKNNVLYDHSTNALAYKNLTVKTIA